MHAAFWTLICDVVFNNYKEFITNLLIIIKNSATYNYITEYTDASTPV